MLFKSEIFTYVFNLVLTVILIFCLLLVEYKLSAITVFLPALDISLIYYFNTNNKINYWQLFTVGLLVDQLYLLPLGINSLTFLILSFLLKNKYLLFKPYFMNIILFLVYCFLTIIIRCTILLTKGLKIGDIKSIFVLYFITVFTYPILKKVLDQLFSNNSAIR